MFFFLFSFFNFLIRNNVKINLTWLGTTKKGTGNEQLRVEIWKEYFDKLLYTEETIELIKTVNREIN